MNKRHGQIEGFRRRGKIYVNFANISFISSLGIWLLSFINTVVSLSRKDLHSKCQTFQRQSNSSLQTLNYFIVKLHIVQIHQLVKLEASLIVWTSFFLLNEAKMQSKKRAKIIINVWGRKFSVIWMWQNHSTFQQSICAPLVLALNFSFAIEIASTLQFKDDLFIAHYISYTLCVCFACTSVFQHCKHVTNKLPF